MSNRNTYTNERLADFLRRNPGISGSDANEIAVAIHEVVLFRNAKDAERDTTGFSTSMAKKYLLEYTALSEAQHKDAARIIDIIAVHGDGPRWQIPTDKRGNLVIKPNTLLI